jgi:hypothetical protein
VPHADDTSFIITNPSPIESANKLNKIFKDVNEWFRNNLLYVNLNKRTYLQFRTKNSQKPDSNITLLNNQITNSTNKKFFGLIIEEMLSWKCYINQILLSWNCHIGQILSRLSSARYAIKVVTPLMSEDTLKTIYHSYVHSIITYGILFWGNSPHNTDIFKTQKWIIRIMKNQEAGILVDGCLNGWRFCLYNPNIQDDTKKTGTFEKPNKN